jgi:biopolymer transport protein ExbB
MMHQLLGRLAQFGGEAALGLLFVLSIVSLGVIGQRVWYFLRRRVNAHEFARQLAPLLRSRDLLRAEALAQGAHTSIHSVALAGLSRADRGLPAVEQGLQASLSRERVHLNDSLALLGELAHLGLFVGIAGSLFDLLAVGGAPPAFATIDAPSTSLNYAALLATVTPAIGGLLVAIPAWLARSLLHLHVQRVIRECEFVARLLCEQLAASESSPSALPTKTLQVHRPAA